MRRRKSRPQSDADHFKSTFSFALLHATQHAKELELIVERRGSETVASVERAIENLYWNLERTVYDQPNIPASFPRCHVHVMGKEEPGLQVVDFVLWANNRAVGLTKDRTWASRLRSTMTMTHAFEATPETGGNTVFKKFIRRQIRMYPAEVLPVGEPSGDDFWNAVALAERILHHFASIELPSHVKHVAPRLQAVTATLAANAIVSHDVLDEAARIFVRLFDTLPIEAGLTEVDSTAWKRLLMAKKMAALRLRKDLLHGVRSADEARWWRKSVLDQDPRSRFFFPETE